MNDKQENASVEIPNENQLDDPVERVIRLTDEHLRRAQPQSASEPPPSKE